MLNGNQFSGPIGKSLPNVEIMDLCEFEPFYDIPLLNYLPAEIVEGLSVDQKYLYNIVISLIQGKIEDDSVNIKIRAHCHSRWLITASRICRLYSATPESSIRLRTMMKYIVQVYTPMWFMVKRNDKSDDNAKNLFFLLSSEDIQCPEAKNIGAENHSKECIFRQHG